MCDVSPSVTGNLNVNNSDCTLRNLKPLVLSTFSDFPFTVYTGNSFSIGTVQVAGNTELDELEDDGFGLSWSEVCTDLNAMTIISGPSYVSITGTRMN